jgi:O-antigen/teichoic acid export membrane protein
MPISTPVDDHVIDTSFNKISRLSLKTNFSWTFLGNLIYTGCQWGMLVALAKLGSSEMVGQFTIGLAVTAPIMQFASLRMRLAQATDVNREYHFGDYLSLRLIMTFLALLVIIGIVVFTNYEEGIAWIILAVGLDKFIEGISDVFYGFFQQNERMDRMAISMIIKGLISLVALGLGVYITGSVFWAVICLAATRLLTVIGYDIPNGIKIFKDIYIAPGEQSKNTIQTASLAPRWNQKTLLKLGWLLLPLGFVVMLSSLDTNIPRYFIERQVGIAELGIFAAIASFDRAGNLIVKALAQSTSPRLSQYYSAGKKAAFRKLLAKTVGIGMLLGAAGVLVVLVAGETILTLFYQPEYARNEIFILLMVAGGLGYIATFFIYGVTATRTFAVQVLIYSLTTITLIAACFMLVPSRGLEGAAIAIILARFVQLISSIATTVNELRKFNLTRPPAKSAR